MAPPKLKIVEIDEPEISGTPLPEAMRIGPYEYRVREIGELERIKNDYLGYCNEGELEIGIAVEEVQPQHLAEVMVHEILHGLFGAGTLRDTPLEEEQIVTVLAKGIIQFARDNPHVLRWINEQYPVIRSA